MRLHDERHSSATLQLNAGVPVHVVSGRLDRSTPSTTLNVYAAFMPSADELAADVMGRKLTAPPAEFKSLEIDYLANS
jgi:hypothetical protein